MTRVLVFGTFDILHPGHLYFLREAKKHGDELTVVVSRSSVVKKIKGHAPLFDERHRMAAVRLMSFVDHVLLGDRTLEKYIVIKNVHPDIICLGHDQKAMLPSLQKYFRKNKQRVRFVRIPAYDPKKYKSAYLKKILKHGVCLHCQL